MALYWFDCCEPDSLIEEWMLAFSLIDRWTVRVIHEMVKQLGPSAFPPILAYLEDRQKPVLQRIGKEIRVELTEPECRTALRRFGINARQYDAVVLSKVYKRFLSRAREKTR